MQYNTQRGGITIREYGRHFEKLVNYIVTIEDRDKRNHYARYTIELMGMLFPHLKNVEDFKHKLWDHLYIMSDFKLDVDSPYPTPTPDTVVAKASKVNYPRHDVKYRHYGHNVEVMIEKAKSEIDDEKRALYAQAIATVMKMTYRNWNNDDVNDDTIKDDLRFMSNEVLALEEDQRIANMQQRQFHQHQFRNNNKNKRHFSGGGGNNNRNRNTDGTSNSGGNNNPNRNRNNNGNNNQNRNNNNPNRRFNNNNRPPNGNTNR